MYERCLQVLREGRHVHASAMAGQGTAKADKDKWKAGRNRVEAQNRLAYDFYKMRSGRGGGKRWWVNQPLVGMGASQWPPTEGGSGHSATQVQIEDVSDDETVVDGGVTTTRQTAELASRASAEVRSAPSVPGSNDEDPMEGVEGVTSQEATEGEVVVNISQASSLSH